MDFDWKKLECEDKERVDQLAPSHAISYLSMADLSTVLLLITGRFGGGIVLCLMSGIPALIVWLHRRRKRNEH